MTAGHEPQLTIVGAVIFNPVNYVVFDGLAGRSLKRILLRARPPDDGKTERLHRSIEVSVDKGNIGFKTLRVDYEARWRAATGSPNAMQAQTKPRSSQMVR